MDINNIPIVKALKEYKKEAPLPLHVPGHKQLIPYDVTEVPGIDNLHNPTSSIMEAQNLAAIAFGAKQTFFLVNGTSCGIYAMILATVRLGEKLIMPRNCHRSVIGAVIMSRCSPIYFQPEIYQEFGIAVGINLEKLEQLIIENSDAKAVVITNPTYYGTCSNIKKIAQLVHKYKMLLLVDEAHGSHFCFHEKMPISAMSAGADIAVQSSHKTLTSMTQSSMLHINSDLVDIERLRFYLQIMQTTSPSHLMLASLDMARYIMQQNGHKLLEKIIFQSEKLRNQLQEREEILTLGKNTICEFGIFDIDVTRFTVKTRNNIIKGHQLENILRKDYNIQVEMSDLYSITAVFSVADKSTSFDRFGAALIDIVNKMDDYKKETVFVSEKSELPNLPEMAILPWQAVDSKKESISIKSSIGRICGEIVAPYPPGVPIIMPGEIMTEQIAGYIINYMNNKSEISVII